MAKNDTFSYKYIRKFLKEFVYIQLYKILIEFIIFFNMYLRFIGSHKISRANLIFKKNKKGIFLSKT